MKVDAVVLAGAPNTSQLKDVDSAKWEAAISIHGKPMVNYVIEALQKTESIEKIVAAAPADLQNLLPERVSFVPSGASLVDNVFLAAEALQGRNNKILLVTADIPLIHAEAIDDFLARCGELQGEIFYPIISQEANEQVYPEAVRTYFSLKEGTFTGGNILLATPEAINNSRWIMDEVISKRKHPWKLFRLLGFWFIIKFLTKRLTLQEVEKQASEILGYTGVAIISPYPELGTDVDKPSDLALATKMLDSVQGREA